MFCDDDNENKNKKKRQKCMAMVFIFIYIFFISLKFIINCFETATYVESDRMSSCLYTLFLFNLIAKWFGLVFWVVWHINLCRLFNAKSIFMKIVLF